MIVLKGNVKKGFGDRLNSCRYYAAANTFLVGMCKAILGYPRIINWVFYI